MRLSARTLTTMAEMICGSAGGAGFSWEHFPYRSSTYLTEFFSNCDLAYAHDGGTRKWWVLGVLEELNNSPSSVQQLPSDPLVRVIQELLDAVEFERAKLDRDAAIEDLNKVLRRDELQVYLDGAGRVHLRNLETSESSAGLPQLRRALTKAEVELRGAVEKFMADASEDEFTAHVLVPLFKQLGFVRVVEAGHRDRALEYGKDVWMKYQLPTNHYLYFGVQVKRERLDSAGGSINKNIATVLDQVRMALRDPIWDPETNRRYLIDHVLIVSVGEITKAAKRLMAESLDSDLRRHILFLDRDDLLDLWIRVQLPAPGLDVEPPAPDDLPF